jgi:hypothetical protein
MRQLIHLVLYHTLSVMGVMVTKFPWLRWSLVCKRLTTRVWMDTIDCDERWGGLGLGYFVHPVIWCSHGYWVVYSAGVYSIWICCFLINSLQLNSANVSLYFRNCRYVYLVDVGCAKQRIKYLKATDDRTLPCTAPRIPYIQFVHLFYKKLIRFLLFWDLTQPW